MSYDPSIFNINPYYDDFSADKSFLRVLFKPGYAVQARELTQLQSILQNQMSKIGNHLFKDGSRIVGGSIGVRNTNYVAINPISGVTDYSFVKNATVRQGVGVNGSLPEGRVVHYILPDSTDGKLILVVDFISGSSFPTSTNISLVTDTSPEITYTITTHSETWTNGYCKLISIDEGIFYVNGFFVKNNQQYFVPSVAVSGRRDFSYGTAFASLTNSIGFSLVRDAVTENEDATLRDPAIGSYNYNAPGADRFVINLILDKREVSETKEDFIELLQFDAGRVTKKVESITYGEIEKTLAERTYDESGSYVVNPFDLSVKLNGATLQYTFGAGKAYVQGHEIEVQYPQSIFVPAARTTVSESAVKFPFGTGNWIGVCAGYSADIISSWGTTFSAVLGTTLNNGSADVYFRNNANAVIGQAKIHSLVPYGFVTGTGLTRGFFKMYLYGICGGSIVSGASSAVVMPHGSGLGSGKTLAVFGATTSGANLGTINSSDGIPLVYDVVPGYAVKSFNALEFYGKATTDPISPSYTNGASPVSYTITNNTNLSGIYTTTNSSIGFPLYTATGTAVASDIQQVTILSNGWAGTTGQAYSPGHSTSLVGFTLSSDGTTYLKLEIPSGQHPSGFTASQVRAVVPIRYNLDNTTLTSTVSSNIRTKTSASKTLTTLTGSSLIADPSRSGRKYLVLPQFDVYCVNGISYGTQDVTNWFELDDGQKETHYDFSRLYLKPEKNASISGSSAFTINYKHFVHGGLTCGPFVGSNSYVGLTYGEIPLYMNSRTGNTISLANCLDFRHSGPTASAPIIKPFGFSEFASNYANATVSYSHYLPRIDKIKLKVDPNTNSGVFSVDQGEPAMIPLAPPDTEDAITLYTILVPAYTHKASDLMITQSDNKRYTMSDIGRIEKRVSDVEIFASLSTSEVELESKSLRNYVTLLGTPASSIEPLKTSLYVDEFVGHNSGDVVSDEHICSVDYEYGELRPFFTGNDISLGASVVSGTTLSVDGICTLDYAFDAFIENLVTGKAIKPNPNNTRNWLGFVELSKSIETYWDDSVRPIVKTNALGENDNWLSSDARDARGFGTQWNDWQSMWTGIEVHREETDTIQRAMLELPRTASTSQIYGIDSGNNTIGIGRRINATTSEKMMSYMKSNQIKGRIKTTVGGKIIDKSVLPYIPTQTIGLTAYGLKPNTTGLSVFFDGISLGSGITTNSNGTASCSFVIPKATFTVGEKLIRVSNVSDPQNALTAAECIFYATGAFVQNDSGSYSTRSPTLRRQTVSSDGIIKSPFNRETSYTDVVDNSQWADPLCQTFVVDKKTYPAGIFVRSIDLFFASIDTVLPVTVQIRPTINGYPSPSVSLPFSTVTKIPSGVTSSAIGTSVANLIPTGFTFSSPVYLRPGEYAIAVLTNSGKYTLHASNEISNTTTLGSVSNNQSVGTLYVPQNTATWVRDNVTDIAFRVNRCVFNSTPGYVQYSATNLGGITAQIINLSATEITPSGCFMTKTVNSKTVSTNQNIYLETPTNNPTIRYSMSVASGVGNTAVSPVVDFGTFCGKAIQTYLSTVSASATNSTTSHNTSSYVTRTVVIPPEITATSGVFVFSNAVVPAGATVNMYCRYAAATESDLYQNLWKPMTRLNPFVSSTESDFQEAIYGITGGNINAYQIKAEFLASSETAYSKTPALKNIRVVTFK